MRQLPPDGYLLAYLREALRLYDEALPTATDIQKFVWRHGGWPWRFIEAAWPYYERDAQVTCVIANAMRLVWQGMTPPEALRYAKPFARDLQR